MVVGRWSGKPTHPLPGKTFIFLPSRRKTKGGAITILEAKTFWPTSILFFSLSTKCATIYTFEPKNCTHNRPTFGCRDLFAFLQRTRQVPLSGTSYSKLRLPSSKFLVKITSKVFSLSVKTHFNYPAVVCPPMRILWAVPLSGPRPHHHRAKRSGNGHGAEGRRSICGIRRASRPGTAASSRSRSGRRASTRMSWSGK